MNFLETLKQYQIKQRTKAYAIASLRDETFWDRVEALDTIICPECKSNIIDQPYEPNRCNICTWSEDGRTGEPCRAEGCEGDIELITPSMSFCFSCNTPYTKGDI